MKRIIAITARDLKSGVRDFMVVYIIIAPFLVAFALSLFVPAAGAATFRFAVDESVEGRALEYLSGMGDVEVKQDVESIQRRVLQSDDVIGVIKGSAYYEVILEGNETEGTAEVVRDILMYYENQNEEMQVETRFSDIGWQVSPLAQYGAISIIIMTTILGGMMISFQIVEEKQSETIRAVNISPVNRGEFIIGKSLLGFIIPVIQSIGVMLIFGFGDVNFPMLILLVLCSSLVGIVIGFVIGVIANDQISAISSMKMTFLPVAVSVLGAILLPSKWMPVLYWSPFYWTFAGVNDLILKQQRWGNTLLYCSAILVLSALIFLLLKGRIRKGLA